jgi:Beta protein
MAVVKTPNNQPLYVPLLKGKQGEFRALLNLGVERNHVIPLLEHEPCSITDATALKTELETKYVQRFIKSNWIGRAFIDLYHVRKPNHAGTLHPIELVLNKLSMGSSIQPTPVVGLHYPSDFKQVVAKLAPQYGVCIRVRVGAIDLFDLLNLVDDLLKVLNVKSDQSDLILDFGSISSPQMSSAAFTAVSLIQQLSKHNWRTFTLAAGAFPLNLEQVKGGTYGRIERCDWLLWEKVFKHLEKIPMLFGDYGINHPDFPVSSGYMTIVPSLRYTLLNEPFWLVLKEAKSDLGNKGFFDLCRRLVRMPEYAGRSHCWADDEIYERSLGRGGPGNATSWREFGTVHHITTVIDQLASFHGI